MSTIDYKNEIRTILSKVKSSFKNENIYEYELYEDFCELEKCFESIENENIDEESLIRLHDKTLDLLK